MSDVIDVLGYWLVELDLKDVHVGSAYGYGLKGGKRGLKDCN